MTSGPFNNPLLEFPPEDSVRVIVVTAAGPDDSLSGFAPERALSSTAARSPGLGAICAGVVMAGFAILFVGMSSDPTAATAETSHVRSDATPPSRSQTLAPTVTVTYPTSATHLSVPVPYVVLGGTAANAVDISLVSKFRNGERPSQATGVSPWIAGVFLERGENTIEISARNSAGVATTRSVVVTFDKQE